MMSRPHFEQLRTRLKGLGFVRVGMKKLKNSHKGGCCASFAQHNMLCEFHTTQCVVRKFRIPMVLQDREHAFFENWSQKRIRTRFAFLCIFALRFWKGSRACFLKIGHKREFALGDVLCENFAQGEWVV